MYCTCPSWWRIWAVPIASPLQRFVRIRAHNRWLLAQAGAALTIAALFVTLLPFRKAIVAGCRRPGKPPKDESEARRITWAIGRVAEALPWRALCLHQGLAAQWLLRQHGFDARLRYGIGLADGVGLAAHVWVTLDGETILGADVATDFREVANYPRDGN